MRKFLILAIAAAPLALAAPAMASDDDVSCPEVPAGAWLSLGEIEGRLQAMGYQVREIERERNCYEFEGVDANGAKVEGYVDPRTGELVQGRERTRRESMREGRSREQSQGRQ